MSRRAAGGLLVAALYASGMGCGGPLVGEGEDEEDALIEATAELSSEDDDRVPAPYRPGRPYRPDFDADETGPAITQRLFPARVGAQWIYEAKTEDGTERTEVTVEAGTKRVFGMNARIVRDVVRLNGEVIEDTRDWFGQDDDRNVWYLGEDTTEFEDGKPVSKEGSWQAGIKGALPGVLMLGRPRVGDVYRQEYFKGEAEDYGRVVAVNLKVSVPAGTFRGCLKTRDRSAIEPAADEYKYYCPGVGLVLTKEGTVRQRLIHYSGL